MPKRNLKIISIALLIVIIVVPTYVSLVSSATGYIRINSTSESASGQTVEAGGDVNLYFGDVTWDGTQLYLLLSYDSNTQPSTGDVIYTPVISVSNIINQTHTHSYSSELGNWIVGNNWINGSIAPNVPVGNYYIKAFDNIESDVAVTDVYIGVYSVAEGTLEISPSSGPGGIDVTLTGSDYPFSTDVTIAYYDPTFDTWNALGTTTSNGTGHITFTTIMPDLRDAQRMGDFEEMYAQVSFRSEINGVVYGYADYNQYLRGLKTVGTQTATGLYGNGTNLSGSLIVEEGDSITLSGKWFHPGVIYVRWDGSAIVGTVTSSEWATAIIIGTSVADQTGYFETTVEIPAASAGEHYLAIEDSESRVMIKVFLYYASLEISPASGPGGVDVTFTGSGYQASEEVDITYYDPVFESWNPLGTTITSGTGQLTFTTEMPDLRRSLWAGDYSENYNQISFRAENDTTIYSYTDYNQYARGIKTVGTQTADGLYGNGTDLSSSVIVEEGDSITVSGKWFHPGVIYVRWDGSAIVGTVTSSEWATAEIIGTSVADQTGYFDVTLTIPEAEEGVHFLSIEDSEIFVIIKVYFDVYVAPPPPPPPLPPPPPATYDLCVQSLPVSGIEFMFNSVSEVTPHVANMKKGLYSIEMPESQIVEGVKYVFQNWTDGIQTRARTGTLTTDLNLTAQFAIEPVAQFIYSPQISVVNEPVNFDASTSYDSDGDITSYSWNFGDDTSTTTTNPVTTHSYDSTNTYQVTLTVTDNTGLTSSVSYNVSVKLLTKLSISTSSSSSTVGFEVDINGTLRDIYGTCLVDETVVLKYAFEGTSTWTLLTSDQTDSNGDYSAVWIPPATGDFTIKAEWEGNSTHMSSTASTTINSITYDGEYVFSVESNSTISNLSFNSTDQTLSFTAQGTSGTQGYAKIIIDKTLVTDLETMKVYLDGEQVEYSVQENEDSWCLTINYEHSTHTIVVSLDPTAIPEFSSLVLLPLFIAATIAGILYKKKLHQDKLK